MKGTLSHHTLVREVRRALYRLYDPTALRKSPLVALFGLDSESSSSDLQRIFIDAINALKPDASASPQSDAWRIYSILSHRFIDQFGQKEVAANLGLSIRQMRRQERMALHALADHLWAQYDLESTARQPDPASSHRDGRAPADAGASTREKELQWLEASYSSEPTAMEEMVHSVLDLSAPLMQALRVQVECAVPEDLPRLAVQPTSLRQALLSVLTAAIRAVPGGSIQIWLEVRGQEVSICIHPVKLGTTATALAQDGADSLEMARDLARLSGGSLRVQVDGHGDSQATITLYLPAVEQLAVLFIDDNADTLQLFQRYLAGSPYLFIGARDPEQALALAGQLAPKIVVLDVMLPGVDGWELLGRLREHPKTRGVPIVVCTILPLEQFALTLGATGFVLKPVSQDELLATLDEQARLSPTASQTSR